MFGLDRPNRLLQPWKNVKQFSEELYAMLTQDKPIQHDGPVTIRVPEGQTALKLVRGEPGKDAEPAPSIRARPIPTVPTPLSTGSKPASPGGQSYGSKESKYEPLISIHGGTDFKGHEPVRFDTPPQIYNPKNRKYEVVAPFDYSGPNPKKNTRIYTEDAATSVYVGKVSSGTGNSYQVAIYPLGPNDITSAFTVTVTVPMIDPDETIDAGTWIFGIHVFTDSEGVDSYFYQPAVWVS